MSIHVIGIIGLVVIFILGTLRPVNIGVLALVLTYLVSTLFAGEGLTDIYRGFPVDLLILLVGVTYLFGVAMNNGTVEWIVAGATRLLGGRRPLIPWLAFVVAALPAMAGALGSAGVALLAPLSLRLAQRHGIDRRLVGLMVVHGAAGIVTYVAALQRYGTVEAIGGALASLDAPLLTALLICAVGAFTSAFASSAGILGAMIPLAIPFMARGDVATTGMVVALAISVTVVDATPFSTVGALVVASTEAEERSLVYRALLAWGAVMVLTAPIVSWLLFVVAA